MAEKTKAHELAGMQKEISISEFFTKNRHLLGFDNPTRALLMAVKEAVDNSLDAVDETDVLPEIYVEVKRLSESRYIVIVEDNGPGIVKANIPKVFGKLLYGSKFHRLRQNRGQQGIGISAVVLYSQLTTGKPVKIISKISANKPAHYYELNIDTQKNEPKILKEDEVNWDRSHGTKVEIELEARYLKGKQSVDEYIKGVAIINPHAKIVYKDPDKQKIVYPSATHELPAKAKEIKPHPYGVELGTLLHMLNITKARTLQSFFMSDFCKVGNKTAKEICDKAKIKCDIKPRLVTRENVESLMNAIKEVRIHVPPTDCLSSIGAELLEKSLRNEIKADFYVSTTRSPGVYRGFPFQIECAIAHGGDLNKEDAVKLLRFANKVPLLYQTNACAITEAVSNTNWKPYGLQQSGSNMPIGPAVILVHMASVWVPFTSEAKEAIAHYDEIIKEMKLCLQDCGRKLGIYIRKHIIAREQEEKIDLLKNYSVELGRSLSNITGKDKDNLIKNLLKIVEIINKDLKIEDNKK